MVVVVHYLEICVLLMGMEILFMFAKMLVMIKDYLCKINSCSLKGDFYSFNNILESFSQFLVDSGTLFLQVCRLQTCLLSI